MGTPNTWPKADHYHEIYLLGGNSEPRTGRISRSSTKRNDDWPGSAMVAHYDPNCVRLHNLAEGERRSKGNRTTSRVARRQGVR